MSFKFCKTLINVYLTWKTCLQKFKKRFLIETRNFIYYQFRQMCYWTDQKQTSTELIEVMMLHQKK